MDPITEYILLHEQELLKNFLGRDELFACLLSKNPFNRLDKSSNLYVIINYRGKIYSEHDYGFQIEKLPKVWFGEAGINSSYDDEFEDFFPNISDDKSSFLNSLKQKKPIKNIKSISIEVLNHGSGYFTSFAHGQIGKIKFGSDNYLVKNVEIKKHYYKPLVMFKNMSIDSLNDYDSRLTLK